MAIGDQWRCCYPLNVNYCASKEAISEAKEPISIGGN